MLGKHRHSSLKPSKSLEKMQMQVQSCLIFGSEHRPSVTFNLNDLQQPHQGVDRSYVRVYYLLFYYFRPTICASA